MGYCIYCKSAPHLPGCPLFEPPKAKHNCKICNEGILNGEEYIENEDGDYAHYDCVDGSREMAKFLDVKIEVMGE